MAEKQPVVMISSTVHDLHQHRQLVLNACLRQNMMPKMMEHLGAADAGGLDASMRLVDEADVYLAIIGHRYGTIPKGKTKSITHYEYERATERGIPRFIFMIHNEHKLTYTDVETGPGSEKLNKFKTKLLERHTVNYFRSPEELHGQVVNTLANHRDSVQTIAASIPAADTVLLTASLTINQRSELVQKIGCPCLVLTLKGRSQRPGKVASAALHVCGPHVYAAFQDAFDTKFGCEAGNDEFIEPPSFYAGFLPASKPDTPGGFLIEQDDVRKFFIPSHQGHLLCFIEAPADAVSLRITHIDGRMETLLSGVEVQEDIPTLIRMCLDKTYNLNPGLILPIGFTGRSLQKPDAPTPGILNIKPFGLPPHPDRDQPGDAASEYIRLRAKILRAGAEKNLASEEWLLATLKAHPDKEVRRDAIVVLRRLATPSARALFTEMLGTETNEITRELIIRSFALVGNKTDLPRLESLAQEETSQLCREAAKIACHYLRHRQETAGEGSGNDAERGEGMEYQS